jgi:pyruvate kinase
MTEIIVTLGPACESPEQIRAFADLGVRYFRLNFSHGSHPEARTRIERVREYAPKAKIVLDTKGPDIRTGDLPPSETIAVAEGDDLILTIVPGEQNATKRTLYVDYDDLLVGAKVGDRIILDSGEIVLQVSEITEKELITKVLAGGVIGSRRHVNLANRDISLPTIGEREKIDLQFGHEQGVDVVALSFARSAADVETVRALVPGVVVWAKIEDTAGVRNLTEIITAADGVMVARGDLGAETDWAELPALQERMIREINQANKFGIVATEMLESMITKNRPTRAEVTDVTLAVWQGADAVMLSGETAIGQHPLLCIEILQSIIAAAERSQPQSPVC